MNVKLNLCENEVRWYTDYNRSLAKYMTSVGGVGIDLTQNVVPPRSLYIEVCIFMLFEDGVTNIPIFWPIATGGGGLQILTGTRSVKNRLKF